MRRIPTLLYSFPVTPPSVPGDPGLRALLAPRAIAVLGASDDPVKIGGRPLAFLLRYQYAGKVYPVNPSYNDPRDCQVYAAQGYYGPVAVPLAPVVHHTYNYGWGVPSSRLTPVGNYVAPY